MIGFYVLNTKYVFLDYECWIDAYLTIILPYRYYIFS